MTRRITLAVIYFGAAWLFGGVAGLLVACLAVAARLVLRLRPRDFWAGATGALVAAPIATIAQGLPHGSVVGPQFGEGHIVAHVLVGISLALASFAGMLELDRTWWRAPPSTGEGRTGPASHRGAGRTGHLVGRGLRGARRAFRRRRLSRPDSKPTGHEPGGRGNPQLRDG